MAISMLKIRRPLGRLIFNMGIAIPGKTVFLIETAPWLCVVWGNSYIPNVVILMDMSQSDQYTHYKIRQSTICVHISSTYYINDAHCEDALFVESVIASEYWLTQKTFVTRLCLHCRFIFVRIVFERCKIHVALLCLLICI